MEDKVVLFHKPNASRLTVFQSSSSPDLLWPESSRLSMDLRYCNGIFRPDGQPSPKRETAKWFFKCLDKLVVWHNLLYSKCPPFWWSTQKSYPRTWHFILSETREHAATGHWSEMLIIVMWMQDTSHRSRHSNRAVMGTVARAERNDIYFSELLWRLSQIIFLKHTK